MENSLRIHTLRSSSTGNSELVCGGNTNILVDCGISGKIAESCFAELGFSGESINGILVTHEHTDHIKGVGILSRKYNLPIYANERTWRAMKNSVGKVSEDNIRFFRTDEEFKIGSLKVRAFEIPHDAADPVGYTIRSEAASVAIATDIGEIRENIFEAICGCDEILLEANYDSSMLDMGSYPYELKRRIRGAYGHLSNNDAGAFAVRLAKSGTKKIILAHLSRENNYPGLAFHTVRSIITESGFDAEGQLQLSVAQRDSIGDIKPV